MTYSEFRNNLAICNDGNTEARNKANGRLLKFREKSPEQYQQYHDRLRNEIRSYRGVSV